MRAITYRFEVVRHTVRRRPKCRACKKVFQRQKTFEATVNPFNRNVDGSQKSYHEIRRELAQKGEDWFPDNLCSKCEGHAPGHEE